MVDRFDVRLSWDDVDLMMKIIEDWSAGLDLVYPENKVLFDKAEGLYDWLSMSRRENSMSEIGG